MLVELSKGIVYVTVGKVISIIENSGYEKWDVYNCPVLNGSNHSSRLRISEYAQRCLQPCLQFQNRAIQNRTISNIPFAIYDSLKPLYNTWT